MKEQWVADAFFNIEDPDKAAWLLVLNLERAFYNAQFERGILGAEAFATLEKYMAKIAAEAQQTKGARVPRR